MSAEVLHLVQVELEGETADDILKAALGKCECVLVIGYTEAGGLYMASTECVGEGLLLMERAKAEMIQ